MSENNIINIFNTNKILIYNFFKLKKPTKDEKKNEVKYFCFNFVIVSFVAKKKIAKIVFTIKPPSIKQITYKKTNSSITNKKNTSTVYEAERKTEIPSKKCANL